MAKDERLTSTRLCHFQGKCFGQTVGTKQHKCRAEIVVADVQSEAIPVCKVAKLLIEQHGYQEVRKMMDQMQGPRDQKAAVQERVEQAVELCKKQRYQQAGDEKRQGQTKKRKCQDEKCQGQDEEIQAGKDEATAKKFKGQDAKHEGHDEKNKAVEDAKIVCKCRPLLWGRCRQASRKFKGQDAKHQDHNSRART